MASIFLQPKCREKAIKTNNLMDLETQHIDF